MNIISIQVESNLAPSTCSECGGKCCQRMPGLASPRNFPSAASLFTALDTGRWAIDWWEGDPRENGPLSRVYYIRPATKGKEGKTRHPIWGGHCTFHSDNGCTLTIEERPDECLGLKPKDESNRGCYMTHSDKFDLVLAWIPRQHEFEEYIAMREY